MTHPAPYDHDTLTTAADGTTHQCTGTPCWHNNSPHCNPTHNPGPTHCNTCGQPND